MNRKTMAVCMIAAMVAAVLCAAVPADADDSTNGPRYIIGAKDKAYPAAVGQSVQGEFIINSSAFDQVPIGFAIGDWISSDGMKFTNGDGTIAISEKENGAGHSVSVTSTSAMTINAVITVTVGGPKDGVNYPSQSISYGINAVFYNDGSGITFTGGDLENKVYTFGFETEIGIKASVEGAPGNDYRFYAVDLPSGIAMTLSGNIAGVLSKECKGSEGGTATIYAVSQSGSVLTKFLSWKIGDKVDFGGDFVIKRNGKNVGSYDTAIQGAKLEYTLSASDEYELKDVKFKTPAGDISPSDGKYVVYPGTGKMVITVEATVVKILGSNENGTPKLAQNGKTVTKTFTIYAIGQLVDSDLDPSVTVISPTTNP